MFKSRIHIILVIALLLAGAVKLSAQTVPPESEEGQLIAVLKYNKGKVDACRGLALIGTKQSVPALAALLGDEELSHMARYALEPIKDPAVDVAFRDALGTLKGRPLIGVIGSVGVRRDAEAVRLLASILAKHEAGPDVTSAAVRALGSIGNEAAAEVLQTALAHAPKESQLPVAEGLFRCAELLAAEGKADISVDLYDALLEAGGAHQVRAGALRGAILARGSDGVALLAKYLKSDDYIMFSAAAQTAMELPDPEVTEALTAGLGTLPADNQILVLWTLGRRGDAIALPAVYPLARSGPKNVRIEAIRVMPQFQDGAAVSELVKLMGDADKDIAEAAQDSLAAIPGRRADSAVVAMFRSDRTDEQLTALELMGRRRMTSVVPVLVEAASDADPEVRPAVLRRVGGLGGPAQVPALLDLLMNLEGARDLSAAERALISVCSKSGDSQSYTDRLIGLLGQAGTAQRSALLRVLGAMGGPQALDAVRKAAADSDTNVRDAAIRVLCGWETADAAPDLLELAKASGGTHRTAALRGYINLIRDEGLSTEKKLAMCKQADALIERTEEKRLLLGALSTVPSVEALSMAMANLDNQSTRNEAGSAAAAIGSNIAEQHPREVTEAMQKVLKSTSNRNITRSAREALNKARQ
jgi:HEAT repeat protein